MCQGFGSFRWDNNSGAAAYFEDYYKEHIEILQPYSMSNGGILRQRFITLSDFTHSSILQKYIMFRNLDF
jgi:hypothetical protein